MLIIKLIFLYIGIQLVISNATLGIFRTISWEFEKNRGEALNTFELVAVKPIKLKRGGKLFDPQAA